MSTHLTRPTIIAVWLVLAFGLFAVFGPPLTLASGGVLAFVVVGAATMLFILGKAPSPTLSEVIAEELRPSDRSRAK